MSSMSAYDYGKAKYKEIQYYFKQFSYSKHGILLQGYFRPGDKQHITNTGSTSTIICSYQDTGEVSNILKQIGHSCITSIVG